MSKKKPLSIRGSEMPDVEQIYLGREVRFTPSAFYQELTAAPGNGKPAFCSVVGKICYIHWAHRYFTVAYKMHKKRFLESFKF